MRATWGITAVFFVSFGCSGRDGGGGLRATVGPEGGQLHGTGIEVVVPAGALNSNVELVVDPVPVPPGYRAAGATAYRFRPEGIRFAIPVNVRFDVGDEATAKVYWSDASGTGFDELTTRNEGMYVVAQTSHFSTGFAGWIDVDGQVLNVDGGPDSGFESDGGTDDGAAPDAAVIDAAIRPDGGSHDGDAAIEPVTGVTCEVSYGEGEACTPRVMTYENVEFHFVERIQVYAAIVGYIRSPLYPFQELYLSPDYVMPSVDNEGAGYIVGGDGLVGLTRTGPDGLTLQVNFDAGRSGSCFSGHRIRIQCSGSTRLAWPAHPDCWSGTSSDGFEYTPEDFDAPAFACTVTRRDAQCVPTVTTEIPTARFGAGYYGPESRLYLDSPALRELGGGEPMVFYQDAPCHTYARNIRDDIYGSRLIRRGNQFASADDTGRIGGTNPTGTTCVDGVGRHPLLLVQCTGVGTITSP